MITDTPRPDAKGADSREAWLARIDEICAEEGYCEPVGPNHHAYFHDDGPVLLVTFETMEQVRAHETQMPRGWQIATKHGWSHLCLIAEGETWYRDAAVYRYFDRLVDDAFFEDFDRVLFYGAGMGGYAAAAFSVCAPGGTVLTLQPRATLDPGLAGWDRRNLGARKLNFTDRYGFAPDMIEGAHAAYVIHDPDHPEDAMHAALFAKPHVTRLPARHFGTTLETTFANMGILDLLIERAMIGKLDRQIFARALRMRRNFSPYLRRLVDRLEAEGKLTRALAICRSINKRIQAPRFRRRQADLEAKLGLPASPAPQPGPKTPPPATATPQA